MRKGHLAPYRFSLQVWNLHVTDFKIKIEYQNYKIKIKIENQISESSY